MQLPDYCGPILYVMWPEGTGYKRTITITKTITDWLILITLEIMVVDFNYFRNNWSHLMLTTRLIQK